MAYEFHYRVRTTRHDGAEIFYDCSIGATDADYDEQMAFAKEQSYNGEVTVDEIPDEVAEPTAQEDNDAMLVDHEYRITLLELGITEV